jgi:hypothetical protein
VRRQLTADRMQRRAAPGRAELRRLRAGVFRLGSFVGLDTRAVLRFSEVISGRRWRRCGSADLEEVVADLARLANRTGAGGARR